MNIQLTIPDESLPAWERRIEQFNSGSGEPPVTLTEFLQTQLDTETERHTAALKVAQREALIPVADQILAAPLAKQEAAIAAALQAIQ
jgi:hypothetical protein